MAVVDRLGITPNLVEMQRNTRTDETDAASFSAYLVARSHLEHGSPDGYGTCVELFEQAIASAPRFAAARAGLVEACIGLVEQRGSANADSFATRARRELAKALDLEATSADVQIAAAEVDYRLDWALDDAAARLREVLTRRPGSARIHRRLAECLIAAGKSQEAIGVATEAAELDLFSPRTLASVGRVLHFAGEYPQSVKMLKSALRIVPDAVVVRLDLAMTLAKQGDSGGACVELDRALATLEGRALVVAMLGNRARARGNTTQYEAARRVLAGLQKQTPIPPASQTLLETSFGETGQPLEYLARKSPSAGLVQYLGLTPIAGSLSAFVDRVGLIAYLDLDDVFQSLWRARSLQALLKLLQDDLR